MKLVIVTAVKEYQDKVLKVFQQSGIENFSSSSIDGYKNQSSIITAQSWFPSVKGGNQSLLYFSFTQQEMIESLLNNIKELNTKLEDYNPIRAIVLPIEQYI
ncbi:MAG: hypothetical protein ACON4X_07130 [Polaribacter sp.]